MAVVEDFAAVPQTVLMYGDPHGRPAPPLPPITGGRSIGKRRNSESSEGSHA